MTASSIYVVYAVAFDPHWGVVTASGAPIAAFTAIEDAEFFVAVEGWRYEALRIALLPVDAPLTAAAVWVRSLGTAGDLRMVADRFGLAGAPTIAHPALSDLPEAATVAKDVIAKAQTLMRVAQMEDTPRAARAALAAVTGDAGSIGAVYALWETMNERGELRRNPMEDDDGE